MNKDNYDALNNKIYDVYKAVADRSENNVALEMSKVIKNGCNKDDIIDCGGSIDISCNTEVFPC